MFARLSLAGLTLALGIAPAFAGDYPYRPTDPARYPTPAEHIVDAMPRDTIGRYPRASALGADSRIPLGAYLPVPPNAFNEVRPYALGEAALPLRGYAVHRRHARVDVKGYARHDRRVTAWRGDAGGRRAMVEEPAGDFEPVYK
jgi:hypothetical protein